ncbi:putative abc transporter [Phaeomoniella chlamydospora]|uniref:Putative abc transporter n=1 Tax=Phaeomoniella chlamydospora TaxID=158046 RepID=A0A0G2F4H4_PHACM|nr:putative abc transporter [Phaeomoniella chlamydospora]
MENGEQQHWAIIGPDDRTTLLKILRGDLLCIPPSARKFPYLSSDAIAKKDPTLRVPSRAVQYVGFAGDRSQSNGGVRGAYLSARYESHREDTDWSVMQYLRGETELNPADKSLKNIRWNEEQLSRVIKDLKLGKLVDMPVANLSNGQTRRARIAKALLGMPEVLLLDEPFMGLDPPTLTTLSPILRELAYKSSPRLVLALRPQDQVPDWTTHLLVLGENHTVALQGRTRDVLSKLSLWTEGKDVSLDNGQVISSKEMTARYGPALTEVGRILKERDSRTAGSAVTSAQSVTAKPQTADSTSFSKEPIIYLKSVIVKYGDKIVLGRGSQDGLDLSIFPGTRMLVLGPNGSGKTTLLSLLTSDHPQSYCLPVFHFGRSRLPQPGQAGISIFDIQNRIGHSSPEIHAFFPRNMSIRGTLESAWSETFVSKPTLNEETHKTIDAVLQWFEPELNPHHSSSPSPTPNQDLSWATAGHIHTFSTLPFPTQRLLLLLRALIKKPDIVILDEAFSGLSPYVREKAIAFLETGCSTTVHPGPHGKGWIRTPTTSTSASPQITGLGENQALIVVSHVREEVPRCVDEWIRLPGEEEFEAAEMGGVEPDIKRGREGGGKGVAESEEGWRKIWGL